MRELYSLAFFKSSEELPDAHKFVPTYVYEEVLLFKGVGLASEGKSVYSLCLLAVAEPYGNKCKW